jgi:predicted permease
MHDSDMNEEMRFHIDARAADLERRGIPPEEAARRARIEFGGIERYQDEGRKARGLEPLDRLATDLRFTLRSLRQSPMFAAIAVATLAIGIGANAVIFSAVNGILLKPLAYPQPQRLYSIRTAVPQSRLYPDVPVNPRHLELWRRECSSCESMSIVGTAAFNLGGAGEPQRVEGLSVNPSFFRMLGISLPLGHPFTEEQDTPESDRVIVISDALWRRSFGASPEVIGKKVTWNQSNTEIIGVLPADFRFPKGEEMGAITRLPDQVDVIRPIRLNASKIGTAGSFNYGAILRLRPGRTIEQAAAEMNRPLEQFSKEAKYDMRVKLFPLQERITNSVRRPLWLLTGAAVALLLIVCVNLGNLMMARAAGRHRDWAIRAALGASRADLFRQALAESVTLALLGGVLGAVLAAATLRLFAVSTLPRLDEVSLDWRVLVFTFCVSAAAGVLCSLAPVWRMLRADPQEALRAGSPRTTETGVERKARHLLVSFEAGLSMALAAAAGLLIVSFVRVMSVDKGFNPDRVLTFQLDLPENRYKMDRRNQFHTELLAKLQAEPGVAAAGLTSYLPLEGEMWISQVRRKGETRHFSESPQANYRFISPGYIAAIGARIVRGRGFQEADRERKVALISERAARKLFTGEDPIGQSIQYNDEREPSILEIVGIVADVKTAGLETEPPVTVYLPFWRPAPLAATYVLRATSDNPTLISRVRAAVASLDREFALHRVRTMSQIVDSSVAMRRLQTLLAAAFAGAGVLLACLGVFGVVSYGVARRTGEIGVRMALGAARGQVVAMVIKESMRPVLIGLLGGLAAALALGNYLASQLYGVSPRDPAVLAMIAVIVCAAALAASYWPARRAANIEPIRALRWE